MCMLGKNFVTTPTFSDIAEGVICGFGPKSYDLALQAALDKLNH